jgi:hypothetical protein
MADDIARLAMEFEARGTQQANAAPDQVAAKSEKAEKATEGLVASQKSASSASQQFAKSVNAASAAAAGLATGHGKLGAATMQLRMQQMELMHVTRSLVDGMVAGISPIQLLAMESGRLAQIMGGPGGLKGALKGILTMLVPFLPAITAIATALGVAFAGAALAARDLNKAHGDLVKTMGLTEQQMERLKDKGTKTSVTIRDVFVGSFNYIAHVLGQALSPVGDFISGLLDKISRFAVTAVKVIVGGFAGAFDAIKATWAQLPAAMGDIRSLPLFVWTLVIMSPPSKTIAAPVPSDNTFCLSFGEAVSVSAGASVTTTAFPRKSTTRMFVVVNSRLLLSMFWPISRWKVAPFITSATSVPDMSPNSAWLELMTLYVTCGSGEAAEAS